MTSEIENVAVAPVVAENRCEVCKELLHQDADRCPKCQSYKGRRRVLTFTGVLLPQVQTAFLIIVGLWTLGGHYDWFTNPHGHSRTSVLAVRLGQPDPGDGHLKTIEADLLNSGRNFPSHIVGCKLDFQGRLDPRVLRLSDPDLKLAPKQMTTIVCTTDAFSKGEKVTAADLAWLSGNKPRPTLQIDIQESNGDSTPLFVSIRPALLERFVRDNVDLEEE
jgi:hypothetical protein